MNKHSGSNILPAGLITLQIYGQRTGHTHSPLAGGGG